MFENLTYRDPLPSLTGLRAFEAMGRTGSATRAAAELRVTHSAISRQVKALEAALGVRLFEGPRHQLRLTERGRALLPGLTDAFDALTAAVRQVRGREEVRMAVHPSLAVKWLVPRLADFERRHPDVMLHLSELDPWAVRQRGADIALRYLDEAQLDEAGVEVLVENRIGLVCSPALVDRLETAPRLTTRTRDSAWADWERSSGRTSPKGPNRTLAHLHMVQDAAVAGLGCAVLPFTLVADDIAAGRLSAPFGFAADGGALAVARTPGPATRGERVLVGWLRDQARGVEP